LSNAKPTKQNGWQRRKWAYLYRAIDSHGDTLYFMLSERRDEDPATAFFKQARGRIGAPKALAVALSFCRSLGLGCPKQAFAKIATPR
jgi:transposase-like protein